jgi:hypothetical protein
MIFSWFRRSSQEKARQPAAPRCDDCGGHDLDLVDTRDLRGLERTLCVACHSKAVYAGARVQPLILGSATVTLLGGVGVLMALGNVGADARGLRTGGSAQLQELDILRAAIVLSQGDVATHFGWLAVVGALVIAGTVSFESSMRRAESLAASLSRVERRDLRHDIQISRLARLQVGQGMVLIVLMCCLAAYAVATPLVAVCDGLELATECQPVQTWEVVASGSAGAMWVWLATEISRAATAYQSSTSPVGALVGAHEAVLSRRVAEAAERPWGPAVGWMLGLFLSLAVPGITLAIVAVPPQGHVLVVWCATTVLAVVLVIGLRVLRFRHWGTGQGWLLLAAALLAVAVHLGVWVNLTSTTSLNHLQAIAPIVGGGLLAIAWGALLLGLSGRGVAKSLYRLNGIRFPAIFAKRGVADAGR